MKEEEAERMILEAWEADLPDPEDICTGGGPHEWYEISCDTEEQVLECRKCGKLSVGWFR